MQSALLQKKSKIKNHVCFSAYGRIYAKMKNKDLHYTSLPRDELPLNSAIQFHLETRVGSIFSLFLSLSLFFLYPDRGTRASLMDLARGTAFDASVRIVSFMTLIMPCMREPRYIMYLIICRAKYIIQNSGGYREQPTSLYVVCYI